LKHKSPELKIISIKSVVQAPARY